MPAWRMPWEDVDEITLGCVPTVANYKTVSSLSSQTSRHNQESSVILLDHSNTPNLGLNMMAGVMTTILYKNLSSDRRSPIPVDYLQPPTLQGRRKAKTRRLRIKTRKERTSCQGCVGCVGEKVC